MLELKAKFVCAICGYEQEGVNIKTCPECNNDMSLQVSPEDLQILPKIHGMANQIDSKEGYQRAREILANASYDEAGDIMYEAHYLLRALLGNASNLSTGKMDVNQLSAIAGVGKEIGELASALKVLADKVLK